MRLRGIALVVALVAWGCGNSGGSRASSPAGGGGAVVSRPGVTDRAIRVGAAQRLYVLHAGRLIASGPTADVMADTAVRQAYLGSMAT